MDDKEILLAIQELLDGTQWYTETVDQISMIVERAGYPIRTFGEMGQVEPAGASFPSFPTKEICLRSELLDGTQWYTETSIKSP